MGQNESLPGPDQQPTTLEDRSLSSVAKLVKSGKATRIVVLTGAGISTAAVPDFRSPKTGLYSNLARLNLPRPEAVFEISFFRQNPEPFYVLAKELYPGKFHPTISHAFVALLASKGLLDMLFTQNIDCLERAAGVPPEKIVEAHGSFATQRCIDCKLHYPDDLMKEHVESGTVPRCESCKGLVKPDIVFFEESLPEAFHGNIRRMGLADLVLIIGTSLSVYPFAALPDIAEQETPRVLFNNERVGGIGRRLDDVIELGPCDAGIRKLADELGWLEELEKMWRDIVGEEEAERQLYRQSETEAEIEEMGEDIVREMASQVEGLRLVDAEDVEGTAEVEEAARDAATGTNPDDKPKDGTRDQLKVTDKLPDIGVETAGEPIDGPHENRDEPCGEANDDAEKNNAGKGHGEADIGRVNASLTEEGVKSADGKTEL